MTEQITPTRLSILQHASPRPDILQGELRDSMFAADFADVAEGKAPHDYQDAASFFNNTHPSAPLRHVVSTVFGVLTDPTRLGGVLQLSTGFGGGKSHTLITLFHLANSGKGSMLGGELLAPDRRPEKVRVVAVDAGRAGVPEYTQREGRQLHSLWADVFYQLAGTRGLQVLGEADDPEASPSEAQLDAVLPNEPVLFLLDELVIYMGRLSERGRKNLMGFLNLLATKCGNRPQTVMVITDPAAQHAYASEAEELGKRLSNATALDDLLGRKSSDYDAIGNETAQVIVRRLFHAVDREVAQVAAAEYAKLYERVGQEKNAPLPDNARHYAERLADTWPLHPRLLDTVQNRLSTLPNFQRGRGVLRLFARILQAVYEKRQDLPCITAGEVDWGHPRVQAELLERLGREGFKPAANADVQGHAYELDGGKRGIHSRVASALLLESLPADDKSGLSAAEVTLAVLRPDEGGMEPSEAFDTLMGHCWHTYEMSAAEGWQFRQQPNIVKQIGERIATISPEDARRRVLSEAKTFFSTTPSGEGLRFQMVHFPEAPHMVPSKASLQLAVCETLDLARTIVEYEDDRDGHRKPRLYRNAIIAAAPTQNGMEEAITRARYVIAAEAIERMTRDSRDTHSQKTYEQIGKLLHDYQRYFQLRTRRAFSQVVLPGAIVTPLEEKYLVSEDELLRKEKTSGQENISNFLRGTGRAYEHHDKLDTDLFMGLLSGAVSQANGSYTIDAVHDRLLAATGLRLVDGKSVAHNSIRDAVEKGRMAIRFPDGSAYGLGSMVTGQPSNRATSTLKPNLASLPAGSVVAPVERKVAQEWLKTDEAPPVVKPTEEKEREGDRPVPPPPPPPTGEMTATDWTVAKGHARTRPLKRITLTVTDAGGATGVQTLATQVNGAKVTVTVSVDGESSDGERARLEFSNMRPSHPLKPLEVARTLVRGLKTSSFSAQFRFTFDPPAPGSTLTTFAERAPSSATLHALFGEETV